MFEDALETTTTLQDNASIFTHGYGNTSAAAKLLQRGHRTTQSKIMQHRHSMIWEHRIECYQREQMTTLLSCEPNLDVLLSVSLKVTMKCSQASC